MPRRAVFVDRDGTINEERNYLADPEEVALLPGAAEGLRRLGEAAFLLVVVTNQSGVARGFHTEEDVRRVNVKLARLLAEEGVELSLFYHCPHHPAGTVLEYARACDCRKPAPGLLLRAAREHDVDLAASWTVGDSLRDLEAGRAAGTRAVLVRTGYGVAAEAGAGGIADYVADDLADAAEWILGESREGRRKT